MTEKNQQTPDHEDVGLYQKLAGQANEFLHGGRKNIEEALKKAGEEVSARGEYTREQIDKISGYVRRDLNEAAKKAQEAGDSVFSVVDPRRVTAGLQSGIAKVLGNAAAFFNELAGKSEQVLEVKTGEVTSPGTLTCKECGSQMHFKSAVKVPPCPQCHKTVFRKSY
ncbi:Zinc-ribbon containing domain-containing protein [Malonomonas rubra DSM 5091]|uniref:Zinc-ribbon containing domain-containing protein n=1 Tax=Malonomonas rubra DSM 5091 TaxID=1122189 RepID=A0A1M6B7N6_MALRU|nr:hypothetical protein [Malonomonas rubra]SHI44493.1 Zinc-ribbon containing domain-containing protein [Malonomonas rubra DSM 5091]